MPGPYSKSIDRLETFAQWCAYWLILGILSSIGWGTGLHTFVLYLAPHIASVTLAAFECLSLDFPEPPYTSKILCPFSAVVKGGGNRTTFQASGATVAISVWDVLYKLKVETLMFGAGTAIGELPPYFVARTARLSDERDLENETYREILLSRSDDGDASNENFVVGSWWDRSQIVVEGMIDWPGFWGILLFTSVPNPLFDLVGVACGHYLVPFWTLFGATLIGKSIIKSNFQTLLVVMVFSKHHVDMFTNTLNALPLIGAKLRSVLVDCLQSQERNLHRRNDTSVRNDAPSPFNPNIVQTLYDRVVTFMIMIFVVSVVNSMAQDYHHRLCNVFER